MSGWTLARSCHDNVAMADWHRLGQLVTSRRIALGHPRREDFTNATPGISLRTLGDIEAARRDSYSRNTIATLEHALRWAPGSVTAILDGGDPTSQPDKQATSIDRGDDALVRVMADPSISERDKMRIARILIDERERFERERVARADQLIRAFRDED
jgi:hypothetical protein